MKFQDGNGIHDRRNGNGAALKVKGSRTHRDRCNQIGQVAGHPMGHESTRGMTNRKYFSGIDIELSRQLQDQLPQEANVVWIGTGAKKY